jgi:hypothetical protein
MNLGSRCVLALVSMVLLAFATGCSCDPVAHNIKVTADEGLRDSSGNMKSVEVHLVGVNPSDKQRWDSVRITQYFSPGNKMREGADKKVFQFGGSAATSQTLAASDPIWKTWLSSGAKYVYVLAFLPGGAEDQEGTRDGRRQVIPLGSCRWSGNMIDVRVRADRVSIETPMKPEK